MDSALNDKRFANIGKDPRFLRVPASTRKVVVDKRFNAMFNERQFKLKYTVDKRGKPSNLTSNEQLKDFYEIESEDSDNEEDDEKSEDADDENVEETSDEAEEPDEDEDHKKSKAITKPTKSILKKNVKPVSGFVVTDIQEENEEHSVELDDAVKAKLQDMNVDYARGEGCLFSDSSSSEEETSEEEDGQDIIHDWGELDKDAGETDTATYRIAVCNMDWDRIRAVDLMVVLQSFAPQGGRVKTVHIFPSEFGLERMKEEEILGPKELVEMKQEAGTSTEDKDENDDEVDDYHREKLRQYQINRLKYYYAVVECDSAETANKIYEECDGQEFESSAARLDLRFIPDDMTFDEKPHDVCNGMPDVSQYEPRLFLTSALQQAQVHLTWDETDPSRLQTMQKLFKGKNGKTQLNVDDERIKSFLATSSEEEEEEEEEEQQPRIDYEEVDGTESCLGENERISKYRNLLASIAQSEDAAKKGKGDMEMEISWGVGLQSKAEEMVKKKMAEKALETPWEQQLAKRREKRKANKQEKKQLQVAPPSDEEESDDIPSDIDMNDPYFKEEFQKEEFRKKPKPGRKVETNSHSADEEDKAAELDLLLMDDNDGKKHFNLKSIIKEETKSGKKNTKKTREVVGKSKDDDFKIQVDDPRFSALFTSHHFNLDPSDSNFKKTEAMETILLEKQKRRKDHPNAETPNVSEQGQPDTKKSKADSELSRLVRSVKVKTSMQYNQKKFKSARP